MPKDNIVGRPQNTDFAYIAGFLDGDGSIMVQLKRRPTSPLGIRLMLTICFYQDVRHGKDLEWIREVLGIGYLSQRRDGIRELRINGYQQVGRILQNLLPYIRFKKTQAQAVIAISRLFADNGKVLRTLNPQNKKKLAGYIETVWQENYFSAKRKFTSQSLRKALQI